MDVERFGREVGARLRAARKACGWSLRDVRAMPEAPWSEAALGSWERGDRRLRAETFAAVAAFYGVDGREVLEAAYRAVCPPDVRAA